MGDNRRYYWLKLKENFFDQKLIKKLRKLAGGDTYTIIYLKMQLKSIKTNGILKFENYEKDLAEELALDLDEEVENVKMTLAFLERYDAIEQVNKSEFVLPEVLECIGSESASAERVRRYRENQKMLQCNANLLQCNGLVTKCNVEIEKEIDIDNKERKKERKNGETTYDKIINEKITDEKVKETIYEFIKMRKFIKSPLTDRALSNILIKLKRFSQDSERQIAILDQSITNSWKDIYELKEEHTNQKTISEEEINKPKREPYRDTDGKLKWREID